MKLPSSSLSFDTNSVKGIQSSTKRLKLMQYFKGKIGSAGLLFLQETHSDSKVEQKWKADFKDPVFFSHGKLNSCGVLIGYFGAGTFIVKKQQTEKEGHILIPDVSINDSKYILINVYNVNTENEQMDVLRSLFELLEEFDISPGKQQVVAGDFNLFFNSKLEVQSGNPTLGNKSLSKLIESKET